MEWTWANERDDKEIKRWLKAVKRGKVAEGDFDFIADVRSGDGIEPGYGESETGKAYDFFGNVGFCFKSEKFKNIDIAGFKQFINDHLTLAIAATAADNWDSVGIMGNRCNLFEKANKPLIVW